MFFAEHSVWISLCAVVICYLLGDKKSLRYALLVAVFYVLGTFTSDYIRAIDDARVYRYIFWALNDIIFMGIVAYWALKDKMYMWQSILAQLIIVPAPIMQLFRLVDRHLMDLSFSTQLYITIIPIVNVATLCLAFIPFILLWKQRCERKEQNNILDKVGASR
ncbi:hypothetical protein [Pseudoalteromonas piscicida]